MLLKSCPRCGKLIEYGNTYCEACAPIVEAQIQERKKQWNRCHAKSYNAARDPKYTRFYNSSEWRRLSQTVMQDKKYKCEECGAKVGQIIDGIETALEVHHVIPIQTREGWPLRYEYDNLKCLCTRCHNKQHGRFQSKAVECPTSRSVASKQ